MVVWRKHPRGIDELRLTLIHDHKIETNQDDDQRMLTPEISKKNEIISFIHLSAHIFIHKTLKQYVGMYLENSTCTVYVSFAEYSNSP